MFSLLWYLNNSNRPCSCRDTLTVKVKLSPKCNVGFLCECIWVKTLCKSIFKMKEALLHFHFWFKLIFNWSVWGKLAIASKLLFSKHLEGSTQHETFLVVSPGSLNMNTSIENEFTKKTVFEQLTLAVGLACGPSSTSHRHGSWECNVTWRWNATVFWQQLSVRYLTWLFWLLISVLFVIWGSFFNFKVNIVFFC